MMAFEGNETIIATFLPGVRFRRETRRHGVVVSMFAYSQEATFSNH